MIGGRTWAKRRSAAFLLLTVDDEAAVSMLIEDMLLNLGVEIVGPASRLDPALRPAREAELEAATLDFNIGGVRSYLVSDVLRRRVSQ